VADVLRDEQLNDVARQVADEILFSDPTLALPAHAGLRHTLTVGYARALQLFQVG
jgi:ATP-dependent DNA helicase RecG